MAVKITDLLGSHFPTLRYEPTVKRIRASVGSQVVADTCHGLLVWEPRRLVPTYAVPAQALSADLVPIEESAISPAHLLDPRNPFSEHTADGQAYDVVTESKTLRSAAFRPDDSDLTDHLLLDFAQFHWREEDRSSPTPTTRSTGSTSCAAAATFGSNSKADCWRNPRDPCCCSKLFCPCGSTFRLKTSSATSSPATP